MEKTQVHVVVGLYGMILSDLTVWTDREKAIAHANELCEGYDCKPMEEDCSEDLFFAMDDKRENEVHIRFDLPLDPKGNAVIPK